MWLPRGELAVPATALCLGAFVLPMHLMLEWNPGLKLPAAALDAGRWALVPGALLVAWLSWRGRRFGGAWGSAWRGLLVTLLLFTPAWGYVGRKAADWRHLDPNDPKFRMSWAYVGEGGRYAFVNAQCGGPGHAILVDLESAGWRDVGDPRDYFDVPPCERGTMQSVVTHVVKASDASTRGRRKIWEHHYDGATGERFKSGWSDMRLEEVEVRRKRNACNTPAYAISPDLLVIAVLDDGSILAIRDRRAIVRVRDGNEEQLFPR
jgi:hypothetical protein